jgi:hypothetical protein
MRNSSPPENHRPFAQISNDAQECEGQSTWQSQSPSFDTPNSMTVSYSDGASYRDDEPIMHMDMSPDSHTSRLRASHSHRSEYFGGSGLTPQSLVERNPIPSLSLTRSRTHTEDAAAELLALRYLPAQISQRQSVPEGPSDQVIMPPPPNMAGFSDLQEQPSLDQHMFDDQDGIFLPGSAYQELHSTLRDHLIYTARSNAPTRHGTPEPQQPDMGFFERVPAKMTVDGAIDRTESDPESSRSSKAPEITPQREYVLWKTWIDEVAPWVQQMGLLQWTSN